MFEKILGRVFGDLTTEQERMKETMVFLLRLLVLAVPLYFIIFFVDLYPLQSAVAYNSFLVMEGMGLSPLVEGANMQVGEFTFFISKDSTAWKSMVFLTAMIFAVPGVLLKKRLWGLLIGLPLVYIGNLGRVVGIVFVEQGWGYEAAMFTHDILWRAGLIVLVVGIWLVWYTRVRKVRKGLTTNNSRHSRHSSSGGGKH
jgi:exosortase/archaeosortase family protein